MLEVYFSIGMLFSVYILFRIVWCLIQYTKAYLTIADIKNVEIAVIANISIFDGDLNNWFITTFGTIVGFGIIAFLTLAFWPIVMILCMNDFLKQKRNRIVGE